ncbi:MAG: phosphatidylserine decarboxylase, partial [Desulfatitalea sp.]|nr:phosphatidylserine decarboxylase [Desulfatitalea sp.]NNK00204.1 phosphatidylserine decarboxylase [Desulfatitalea sp.]
MKMPRSRDAIRIYNRRTGCLEIEKVPGRKWMQIGYGTFLGWILTRWFLCRRPLSRLYGCVQQHPFSRRKIRRFVDEHGIDLDEVQMPPQGFASFNDFFIRRLKPGARPLAADPAALISPADSRLQAFSIHAETRLTIKGTALSVPRLIASSEVADAFQGGCCLVFRLAPSDYHHFGCMDNGIQGPVRVLS